MDSNQTKEHLWTLSRTNVIEIENLPASELINTKTLHLRAHVALTCFAFLS